jgi:hypothetical protein
VSYHVLVALLVMVVLGAFGVLVVASSQLWLWAVPTDDHQAGAPASPEEE